MLSRRFSIDFAQIHQRNHYLWQLLYNLMKCIIRIKCLERQNYSLIHPLQSEYCVGRHENIIKSFCIFIRALGWPGTLSVSKNIFKGISFFPWAVNFNSGHKIFIKPYFQQMHCYSGFVVPFIENRQSRYRQILKGPRIFRMVNEHWLQLQVTNYIRPQQENWPVLGSFEARNRLVLSTIKVLDSIFF